MLTFSYWHWNVDRVDNMIYLINLLDITIIVKIVVVVLENVIVAKKIKNKVLKNKMNTKYK